MRKKILSLITIIVLAICLVIPNEVMAATPQASMSVSKTSIKVGETINVTVSYSNVTDGFIKITSNGGSLSGTTSKDLDFDENQSGSISAKFTASKAGTYTISYSCTQPLVSYEFVKNSPSDSKTITVTEPTPAPPTPSDGDNGSNNNNNNNNQNNNNNNNNNNNQNSNNNNQNNNNNDNKPKNTTKPEETTIKSDNCFLASLSVNQGKLSPEFEKGTKNYDIVFDEGFDFSTLNNIEISAKAEDSKASVTLPDDTSVRDGENTYLVTVYAEDSTLITYSLKLKKPEKLIDSGLRLKTLSFDKVNDNGEISSLSFTPEFNPEVQEYRANVDENIEKIKVNAEAEENVTIEVQGGENLEDGENNIYIYLKNTTEDTNSTEEAPVTVYKIIVDKKAKASEGKKNIKMSKTVLLMVSGIVGILVLLLVCLIIVNKKIKKANEDYEEFIEEEKTEKIDEESENIEDTEKGDKTEDKAEETDDEKEKNGKHFK